MAGMERGGGEEEIKFIVLFLFFFFSLLKRVFSNWRSQRVRRRREEKGNARNVPGRKRKSRRHDVSVTYRWRCATFRSIWDFPARRGLRVSIRDVNLENLPRGGFDGRTGCDLGEVF